MKHDGVSDGVSAIRPTGRILSELFSCLIHHRMDEGGSSARLALIELMYFTRKAAISQGHFISSLHEF